MSVLYIHMIAESLQRTLLYFDRNLVVTIYNQFYPLQILQCDIYSYIQPRELNQGL